MELSRAGAPEARSGVTQCREIFGPKIDTQICPPPSPPLWGWGVGGWVGGGAVPPGVGIQNFWQAEARSGVPRGIRLPRCRPCGMGCGRSPSSNETGRRCGGWTGSPSVRKPRASQTFEAFPTSIASLSPGGALRLSTPSLAGPLLAFWLWERYLSRKIPSGVEEFLPAFRTHVHMNCE